MVQSPSWEANWFAASQEIPRISRNPKVHYRTHKRPPPVYILGQPNPVHIPTSHLLEIHPNIIHPSTPRSPQWSPSLRFPHQDPIHPPLLTHTRHIPSPSHSSWFYHPQNIYTTMNNLKNVGESIKRKGKEFMEKVNFTTIQVCWEMTLHGLVSSSALPRTVMTSHLRSKDNSPRTWTPWHWRWWNYDP